MPGYGRISVNKIWKMLDECLPGYSKEKGKHKWIVKHGYKEFLQLPLGEHAKRRSGKVSIEMAVVRSLARTFEIEECAAEHLPQLRKKKHLT